MRLNSLLQYILILKHNLNLRNMSGGIFNGIQIKKGKIKTSI